MTEWQRIDITQLRDVAADAAAQQAALEGKNISAQMRKKAQEQAEICALALALVESIPEALYKAAETPFITDSGRLVQALIPIACEVMNFCMSTRGSMSERVKHLVEAVRQELHQRTFDGADVFVFEETRTGFYSNVDGDTAEGPCKHFFICAEVELD